MPAPPAPPTAGRSPKDDGRYDCHSSRRIRASANSSTPLGENVLVLARFDGTEGLGELFEYRIEALSTKELGIDFDGAIGTELLR